MNLPNAPNILLKSTRNDEWLTYRMNKNDKIDTPLWTFACETYNNQELQKELLELQDSHGLNVNEMLYCMWLDSQNLAVDLQQLNSRELLKIKAHIKRIRALRRKLRNIAMIYPRMKSLELYYEKKHLYKLYKIQTNTYNKTTMFQLYRDYTKQSKR